MYVIITSIEKVLHKNQKVPRHQLIPLNPATLKEYVVLQTIMSLTMIDASTPDRGALDLYVNLIANISVITY